MPKTRVIWFAVSVSRMALITGMPPATAASKLSSRPLSSALRASSVPWRARRALLAVTTCLPAAMAARTLSSAGPLSPPINSTKTSISALAAMATGSSNHSRPARSNPRSRLRSRALTATTSIGLPQRSARKSRLARSARMREEPTVPRPAIPMRSGCDMKQSPGKSDVASIGCGGKRVNGWQVSYLRASSEITLCSVSSAVDRNFLMLRAAWRMRCSFSTSAMRT